jgi:hypothetical protein
MSVGPKESGEWPEITSSIEQAIADATTPDDLNIRIQSVFQRCRVTEEMKIDASILERLNAIEKDDRYPIKAILLANTLFEEVEKQNPQEWLDLEKKFQLLREKYPEEFEETIEELKKKCKFESNPSSVQDLLLHIYQSFEDLSIPDILSAIRKDIDIFYNLFLSFVYRPLAEKARKKISQDLVIGLRDKAPEIQAMFLKGQSQQIASVKKQYLEQESFENIFKDSCRWRSDLAYECLEEYLSIRAFGRVRTSGLVSGFEASKAPKALIDKCENLLSERIDETENWAFPKRIKQPPNNQRELWQRTIYGQVGSKQIPLTRLNRLGVNQERFNQMSIRFHQWDLADSPGLRHHHSWTHTDDQYIDKCMTHIETLYKNLLDKEKTPEEKLNLIARIHWWGCQACPCERGSAAIMEAICQGLLEGADLPYRLNPEKPVDIYALTEPDEKKFAKDYTSLLQSTELD